MKLTEEQEKIFSRYVDEWLKIALCTDPIDPEAAIAAIKKDYEVCNFTQPKRFVVFSSPRSAAYAAAIFKDHWKRKSSAWKRFINDGTEIITQDELNAYISANDTPDLRASAAACLEEMSFGCHDAVWLTMYSFFLYELKLEEYRKLEPLMEIAKQCGWYAPYSDVCIIQDRPRELHRDDRGRLHNTDGPAISYRDGVAIYCVHGVRVDDWMIENPERITPEIIDQENNAEVRRVLVDKFGRDRYIKEGGASLVAEDDFGKLWSKPQLGDEELRVVEVINGTAEPDGSFKNYFLRVPPGMRTAREAVAWTYGMEAQEYEPTIRT